MEFQRVHMYDEEAIASLTEQIKEVMTLDTIIVCIGTDRTTGDALGPIVGTMLKESGQFDQPVFGTMEDPIHGLNIGDSMKEIREDYEGRNMIGIDACISSVENLHTIKLSACPVHPGRGVGKNIGEVGNYSILGSTAYNAHDINVARLSNVALLAKVISRSLINAHLQLKCESRGEQIAWESCF